MMKQRNGLMALDTNTASQSQRKLEFMFMKHYAPNRCEPSIEVIVERGPTGGLGGGGSEWM